MSYNANIPQPTDIPANSQLQLLANFQAINTFVNVNHVAFDLTDQGKHKWVSMPRQSSPPSTASLEIALFCALDADTNRSELYMRRSSDGDIFPITSGFTSGVTDFGYSVIPSGLIIKWGTQTLNNGDVINPNATPGPTITTILNMQLTQNNPGSPGVYPTTCIFPRFTFMVGTSTFTVDVVDRVTSTGSASAATVQWWVLGV